ncbi:hypothetical protein BDN70DRAFT_882134 [Pholiota conissans]|uniref:Bromo domain-containing protein n=1 Tax=Pholiota conissans TaxID=109636 RepID=A0A9P5YXV7_9AGAR|nr:hypothetical protein BDN70DRAFT_882134 [Pholiota conissans]
MNNLLRTLTESHVKPAGDLRLLLTTVKEGRRQSHDLKITDPFYDSLEGLLTDLKTITIDNRDAEAFLKPVSKAEVPDYYDVIQNPMDFQTMLKKVKQKQYKSKREFKDDLDLIWSNCLTYNAAENHPLRPCVKRLKVKAERLLKHITDRKERADPPIPSDLPSATGVARPRINGTNGYLNGRATSNTLSPPSNMGYTPTYKAISAKSRRDIPFSDTPAIIRTPEGMAMFMGLDRDVGALHPKSALSHTLRELAPPMEYESEGEDDMVVDGASLGDKRKNGTSDRRPRKKARFTAQYPTPLENDDVSQLWWGAVQSDALLANGLPGIPFGPSSSKQKKPRTTPKVKRTKKATEPLPPHPKSLLSMMNTNIKTMRRLRHTHAKFAALNAATAPPEDEEQGGEGGMFTTMAFGNGQRPLGTGSVPPPNFGLMDDDIVDEKIDEAPWTPGRRKGRSKVSGIDLGEENASDCIHWSTNKILEHAGFQGTSKVALDVLSDVTSEYLLNVGRTIKFLTDKFNKTMTAEEIILHTLFESGSSKIQDLERYISDDIERYGTRLGELEKKLVGAYRETTAGEILEDGGLFEEEDEEETGALAIGEFADLLGEDYLGLRELGIAAEFGMSNLTIPKRLLKGKKGQNKPTASKPTEPPPPYPPPPPLVPLTAGKVDDQIGLLKPYYQNRFALLAAANAPPSNMPSLPGPSFGLPGPSLPGLPHPAGPMPPPPVPAVITGPQTQPNGSPNGLPYPPIEPNLVLPDDPPTPAQVKMGPIGQIVKPNATAGTAKKKAKVAVPERAPSASGTAGSYPAGSVGTPEAGGSSPKKKKTANPGVGSGNGKKKKPDGSSGSASGLNGYPLPPVVFASA